MGSTWGAGQRGAGAEFSQGRVGEDRGLQQDCQQPAVSGATGAGAKGPEEGDFGRKTCPLCAGLLHPLTPPAQ